MQILLLNVACLSLERVVAYIVISNTVVSVSKTSDLRGAASTSISPVTTPMVTRLASTSSRVVLPAYNHVSKTPRILIGQVSTYTTDAHQGCQSTWLYPTINIIQDESFSSTSLDGVGDVLPV
jgi:hypothetical protein